MALAAETMSFSPLKERVLSVRCHAICAVAMWMKDCSRNMRAGDSGEKV